MGEIFMDIKADSCSKLEKCEIIKAEREQAVESLRAHLSEQRHDFFNLLQVIYGYTQLKKADKVLEHIRNYSVKLENIGRVYNSKCIKLADLLYNKEKEAESVDLHFEVSAEISFEPIVRMLEDESIIHVIDSMVTAYFYILSENGHRNTTIVYGLKENSDDFSMEIYCREIRSGELSSFLFMPGKEELYWSKLQRSFPSMESVLEFCNRTGLDANWVERDSTFTVRVYKCP
jgi:hypothetical protein